MPVVHGDVKLSPPVSSFSAMPTSSSPRRQAYMTTHHNMYKTSSSYSSSTARSSLLRATSLDRSPLARDNYPSSYTSSSAVRKYGGGSGAITARSSVRSITSSSVGSSSSDYHHIHRDTADILSRISSVSSSPIKHAYTSSRKGSDALHESPGNPILTNYKDLTSDSRSSSHLSSGLERRESTRSRLGSLNSLPESLSSPLKSGNSGSTSSLSSSIKNDTDENSNRHSPLRTRYDTNHNVVPKNPCKEDNKCSPSTSYAVRSLRQQSSSSSSSPESSNDDISELSRGRRSSTYTGATSGYGTDSASTSTSIGGRRTSRDAHDKNGLVGLRNLGNTCFMNSVLQCLSNTKPLLDYCVNDAYTSDINMSISSMKGALMKAFASLMQSMWKGNTDMAVNPQAFKNQIQKFAPRFMGYSQQDAQEFLRYLLEGLHEDVNRITSKPRPILTDIDDSLSESQKAAESWKRYLRMDDSKIVDIFVGQLKSSLQCTVCGHCSVTFDPFWDLSLPIPKVVGQLKLQQCFDLFTKEEVMDGDEKPTCSKCKTRRKCTKRMTIHKFPRILVIHLKRFSPNERYRTKLSAYVDFPVGTLDLSPYSSSSLRSQSCVYSLYAVSNHSGTIYSGHYTAYCKHPYSGEWHDFNDSRVSLVSASSVVASEAYVLFYELTTPGMCLAHL